MVLPSSPTAEGLCWSMSTLVSYPFVCFVIIPTSPKSLAVPGSYQSPVTVNHSPQQSRECAGRPGQQRGGSPRDGSSGQRMSSKQEPAKLPPVPHFQWLSTPAASVNAKQDRTESSTFNFMALAFSVQTSVKNYLLVIWGVYCSPCCTTYTLGLLGRQDKYGPQFYCNAMWHL